MLTGDLFLVKKIEKTDYGTLTQVYVRRDHGIFNGHFPDSPVVPGVCMVQLVKELAEQVYNIGGHLTYADNIKFLSVWNPEEINEAAVSLKVNRLNDSIEIKALIFDGSTTFLKLSATLIVER